MRSAAATQSLIEKCHEVSKLLKSLSHPVRLKVLCATLENEKTVNELTAFCGISQSAMSQFLARMKNEGILVSRRSGHFVFYGIADKSMLKLIRAITNIYCR